MLRNYPSGCVPSWAYQKDGYRIPDSFFHQYTGKRYSTFGGDEIPWLCAKFCRDVAYEHRIVLGSEDGKVGFGFANKFEPPTLLYDFENDGPVTAVSFVPNYKSKIITCHGPSGKVYLIEVDTGNIQLLHYSTEYPERTIKAISFHQNESFVFATGGRSGTISIWDLRTKTKTKAEDVSFDQYHIFPKIEIENAHQPKAKNYDLLHISITSMIHISPHLIATIGNNQETGIRFWDIRYQKCSKPVYTKNLPDGCIPLNLALDRHGDRLFVNTTGKNILEYDTGFGVNPIYAYKYPKQTRCIAGIQCSAVSDHLLAGAVGSNSLIYDLQKETYYGDVLSSNLDPIVKDDTIPKFELDGTTGTELNVVDWSCNGRYMLSLDDENMFIYDNQWPKNVKFTPIQTHSEENPSITVINDDGPHSLYRLKYHKEYSEKSKDPKWNYTAARRIGLHESDMNIPANILPQKKENRKRKVDQENVNILSFFKRDDNGNQNELPFVKREVLTQIDNAAGEEASESSQISVEEFQDTKDLDNIEATNYFEGRQDFGFLGKFGESKASKDSPDFENQEVDYLNKNFIADTQSPEEQESSKMHSDDDIQILSAHDSMHDNNVNAIGNAPNNTRQPSFSKKSDEPQRKKSKLSPKTVAAASENRTILTTVNRKPISRNSSADSLPKSSKDKNSVTSLNSPGTSPKNLSSNICRLFKPSEKPTAPEKDYNKVEKFNAKKRASQTTSFSKYIDAKSKELGGFRMANGSTELVKEFKSVTPLNAKVYNNSHSQPLPSSSFKPPVAPKTNEPDDLVNHESLKHIEKHIIQHIQAEILTSNNNVNWDAVAGLEQAKKTLREIVVFPFLRPDLFKGLRAPSKGVLLFGPPGTGKTLIARCVANQAKATFFNVSVSTVMSKCMLDLLLHCLRARLIITYLGVGEGEKVVRALFEIARLKLPSIIFIDEIDALLSSRKDGEHESSRRVKTEFLIQMDGIATNSDERLLVLGATNKPDDIDDAARRRFPKRLYISLPDFEARKGMIQRHMKHNSNELKESDYSELADMTEGFSGADIFHFAKEAAYGPLRDVITDIENVLEDNIRAIQFQDFTNVLSTVKPTVLKSELDSYLEWDKKFGSHSC